MVYVFNSANRLISATDRNGQTTQMQYDTNKRLSKIIDSAGLFTTFTYYADIDSGKVKTITDPAGRVTQLQYEAYSLKPGGPTQYRLKSMLDPDTYTRSFGYTATVNPGLLTSDKDKRGNTSTIVYDDVTGRAIKATDKDGLAVTNVTPAQIQGVRPASVTKDPNNTALPTATIPELSKNPFLSKIDQAAATIYQDPVQTTTGLTKVNKVYLNRAQEEIYTEDEFGTINTTTRNNASNRGLYLPSQVTDARGQKVSYSYDYDGNITQVSDLLANGTSAPGAFFSDAILPTGLAVDCNGDKNLDFVAQSSTDGITVSYGNGKGLFSAPVKLANYAPYMAVGYLNNDTHLDLVTAEPNNSTTNKINIYLANNDQTQTLKAPQTILTPAIPVKPAKPATPTTPATPEIVGSVVTHLLLADLSGDGALDIVAMGLGYNNEKWEMTLKNNRTGSFTDPANGVRQNPLNLAAINLSSENPGTTKVIVGDVNNDNRQDVVLLTPTKASGADTLNPTYNVLLGQTDGTLSAGTSFVMPSIYPITAAIGRFSSTTKNDLVIGSANTLQIFAGNGTGGFAAPIEQTVTDKFFEDSLRDVNGDGILDLVTKNNNTLGDQYLISYGTGSATFGAAKAYATGAAGSSSTTPIAWGDLDGVVPLCKG